MRAFHVAGVTALVTSSVLAEPFTYQGVLQYQGVPANGLHDLAFRLFDQEENGTQQSNLLLIDDVEVIDGLFLVQLAFPGETFEAPRWLSIQAKADADAAYTTLLPRQQLTSTTSAINHTLEPWTPLAGNLYAGDGPTKFTMNRGSPANSFTFYTLGTPALDNEFGGMYVTGATPGAWPFIGLQNDGGAQVYHYLNGGTGTWNFINGGNRIVLEKDGNVLTTNEYGYTTPKLRYRSINSAAFLPTNSSSIYNNEGSARMGAGPGTLGTEVELPHGAVIESVRVDAYDASSTGNITFYMRRFDSMGNIDLMSTLAITGNAGFIQPVDSTIDFATIDNLNYSYQLVATSFDWPGDDTLKFYRVLITYEVETVE